MQQVEEKVVEQDKSMERLAHILAENGAGGIHPYEMQESGIVLPHIRLYGDEEEGMRVANVAIEFGYPLSRIKRVWNYRDGKFYYPNWELTFRRVAPQSKFGGCRCCQCNQYSCHI